ncbi:MAG: serine hydrolase [Phycisphaerales bacterium]|nr:MAG: serine hydrolase [Phycisphaerales bacterium]
MECKHTKTTRTVLAMVWCLNLLLLPALALGGEAKDLAGYWKGAIKIPGMELEIRIDFKKKDDAWEGKISIPAQGAKDLPLANITVEGAKVAFDLPGVPGEPKFVGEISEDGQKTSGEFTQSGQTYPFSLKRAERRAAAATEALEGFDEFLDQALKDWNTPGLAIGIVVDDEVVYAKGFGHRDLENKLPVTPKTLFAIGSSTKAFTTFLLGVLVDEGLLEWDKPVTEYLPGFRLYDEHATNHMTPRDLVTHRSGLPRHDLAWYNNPIPRAELVKRLPFYQPNKDLRQTYQYNNMMFLTAGYLAGQLTGGTWEEGVRERIFAPLGMTHSNFSVTDSQKAPDFALPYEEKDDEIRKMAFRNIDNVGPAGSINSNIEDMTRWLIVHVNKGKLQGRQIINETTLMEMHTPQMAIAAIPEEPEFSPTSYGMGWMIDTYRGCYRVRHGGNIDGFSALVTLFPRDGLGIVGLVNKNASALPGLATLHAADRILGLEFKDWNGEALEKWKVAKAARKQAEEKKDTLRKTGTQPAHVLGEYAGQYEHPGYGVLKIELKDDRLVMTFNNIVTPLEHWHYDVFNGLENPDDHTFEDMRIRFLTNMKGDVDAVAAPFEMMVDEIIFKRRPDDKMSDPKYLAQFLGKYEIASQTITIGLKGSVLTVSVPGQPQLELVPDRDDEFNLKEFSGISMRFVVNDDGSVTAFFNQPNGVFEAKRMEE